MRRREAIRLAMQGAVLLGAAGATRAFPFGVSSLPERPTLKAAGARGACPIGIAAPAAILREASIARVVVAEFNLLTASGLKWADVHPEPDRYDFAEADWNIKFAEQNGMQIHGHNLCWNSPAGNPAWLRTTLNRSNARAILTSHIATVMQHYRGRISSWDVVNEAIVWWPVQYGGLYPGPWVAALGPEYIEIAFDAARQADPGALRVLNIYQVEQDTPNDEIARKRVMALLKQLKSRGVPVQAVGIESHLDAAEPLGDSLLRRFVDEIREMEFDVLITELDVKETRATGSSRDWDRRVANYYHDYLMEVFSVVQPRAVIFWSLTDRWEGGRRVQGLLQSNLSPRLTLTSAAEAIEQGLRRG